MGAKNRDNQVNQPTPGIYLTGEYASPNRLARGRLFIIGVWVLVVLSIFGVSAMLIFREALAPVVLWVGIASGSAFVLIIAGGGLLRLQRHREDNRAYREMVSQNVKQRKEEVKRLELENSKLKAEGLQEYYRALQERLKAEHMRMRLPLIQFGQSEGLYDMQTGSISYIPKTAAERALEGQSSPEEPEELNLLEVMSQPWLVYAIIGGQRSGKTTQAQNISLELQKSPNILQPIVIAPKMEPGEWAGCNLYVGRARTLERGLQVILDEVERRHNSSQSAKSFPFLPVFLDDWSNIVNEVELAREFIFQASTLFTSANIMLYFILHSDTRPAWGVDERGAALKDAFIKLWVEPARERGVVQPGRSRGFITFPNSKERVEVKLLPPPMMLTGGEPIPEEPAPEPLLEFESEEQRRIYYTIADNPNSSYGRIAELAELAYSAPTNNKLIKEVIEKYELQHCNIGGTPPPNRLKEEPDKPIS